MRALSATFYPDAYSDPVMGVMLEGDAVDTLESIQHTQFVPGHLVIINIFEFEETGLEGEADIQLATLMATQRGIANRIQEKHQAMLFYWVIQEWGKVTPPGALIMDKPAPMSESEYRYVLAQLALHPGRPRIAIVGITNDGHGMALDSTGEIHVEERVRTRGERERFIARAKRGHYR